TNPSRDIVKHVADDRPLNPGLVQLLSDQIGLLPDLSHCGVGSIKRTLVSGKITISLMSRLVCQISKRLHHLSGIVAQLLADDLDEILSVADNLMVTVYPYRAV